MILQDSRSMTKMYTDFGSVIGRHGQDISKSFGRVVAYEITDKNHAIVLDMKDSKVYMSKEPVKTDLTLAMTQQTFDELAAHKYCGEYAFIRGKLQIKGSLLTLKKFNSKVVKTYFDNKLNPL